MFLQRYAKSVPHFFPIAVWSRGWWTWLLKLRASLHYTMKLDHGRWHFSMLLVHGPTSMVRLLQNLVWKPWALKLNVDQEEWPCTKKRLCGFFFNTCLKRADLKNLKEIQKYKNTEIKFAHFVVFLWASLVFTSLLNVSKMWLENLLTTTLKKKVI